MTYECFSEAIFQLAVYWSQECEFEDESLTDEEKYVAFLESLYEQVTMLERAMHLDSGSHLVLANLDDIKGSVDADGNYKGKIKSNKVKDKNALDKNHSKLRQKQNRRQKKRASPTKMDPDGTADGKTTTRRQQQDNNKKLRKRKPTLEWNLVGAESLPWNNGSAAKRTSIFELASMASAGEYDVDAERDLHNLECGQQNPNLIGSWRDDRLIAARTTVIAKPPTPRLADWRAAPWKATSPPKGRSKAMSPRLPRAKRATGSASRRSQGGAAWVIEDHPEGLEDAAEAAAAAPSPPTERLDPSTEQTIKQSMKRAIAHRVTLYGHRVSDLESFYHAVDIDRSGGISIEELHSALGRLDVGTSRRQLDSLLATIDTNDDGQVSLDELNVWMASKSSQAPHPQLQEQETQAQQQQQEQQEKQQQQDAAATALLNASDSGLLPDILAASGRSHKSSRRPAPPAAVKTASDWHSPRGSLTKHMGSHPKTPFNRGERFGLLQPQQVGVSSACPPSFRTCIFLPARTRLESSQIGWKPELKSWWSSLVLVLRLQSRSLDVRSRSPGRFWELEAAPERSRRVQIQMSVDDASRRRAMTERLPRLNAHGGAVSASARELGHRGGLRHAEIAAIVAGAHHHGVPKTPGVLREPMRKRPRELRRPVTVRTMCAALTGRL
jgi:sRNA-binding protein